MTPMPKAREHSSEGFALATFGGGIGRGAEPPSEESGADVVKVAVRRV
jgi:hypothetical protein